MTSERQKAQDRSRDGAVTKCHACDEQHPKKDVMPEGVMPPTVGLSAEEIRGSVKVGQNGANNTPGPEPPLGASDIPDRPAESCVWFEVH